MSTAKHTLKTLLAPYIHGGKHLVAGIGTIVVSFIAWVLVSAIVGDGPPLLLWGIGTVIAYRVIRHYINAQAELDARERTRARQESQR